MQRPGIDIIEGHGGLHEFMKWNGPILTDSGGYQVFSLAKNRKITEEGVEFNSPLNGDTLFLTPESCMDLQQRFGVDIAMVLDECTPYPASKEEAFKILKSLKILKILKISRGRSIIKIFKIFTIVKIVKYFRDL